jgi:uncharacterized protein (DUF1778 family)
MSIVALNRTKDDQINFRISPEIKRDLRITAEARGLSVSSLIHSLIVQAIREERATYPHLFEGRPAPLVPARDFTDEHAAALKDAKKRKIG